MCASVLNWIATVHTIGPPILLEDHGILSSQPDGSHRQLLATRGHTFTVPLVSFGVYVSRLCHTCIALSWRHPTGLHRPPFWNVGVEGHKLNTMMTMEPLIRRRSRAGQGNMKYPEDFLATTSGHQQNTNFIKLPTSAPEGDDEVYSRF